MSYSRKQIITIQIITRFAWLIEYEKYFSPKIIYKKCGGEI